MMIVIEGMDGVGKTTIAKYIAEKYNFKYIDKPLKYFYISGGEKDEEFFMKVSSDMYDMEDKAIKSWYFGLGNIYAARKFKDENVVLDRHLVTNYYWNGDEASEPIYETLIEFSGKPDLNILLYASPSTRRKRIISRDKADPNLSDPDLFEDGHNRMIYFLEKFDLPYVVINTENKTLDEVKEMVDKEVNKVITKNKVYTKFKDPKEE